MTPEQIQKAIEIARKRKAAEATKAQAVEEAQPIPKRISSAVSSGLSRLAQIPGETLSGWQYLMREQLNEEVDKLRKLGDYPTLELLGRAAYVPLGAGSEQLEQFGQTQRGLQAVNTLEEKLGSTGSAFALGLAQEGPIGLATAPIQLARAPRAAGGLARIGERAATTGLEGMTMGALQSVLPAEEGERLQALIGGGLGGLAIGSGLGAGVGLVEELAQRYAGRIGDDVWKTIQAALSRGEEPAPRRAPAAPEVAAPEVTATKTRPDATQVYVDETRVALPFEQLSRDDNNARLFASASDLLEKHRAKKANEPTMPASEEEVLAEIQRLVRSEDVSKADRPSAMQRQADREARRRYELAQAPPEVRKILEDQRNQNVGEFQFAGERDATGGGPRRGGPLVGDSLERTATTELTAPTAPTNPRTVVTDVATVSGAPPRGDVTSPGRVLPRASEATAPGIVRAPPEPTTTMSAVTKTAPTEVSAVTATAPTLRAVDAAGRELPESAAGPVLARQAETIADTVPDTLEPLPEPPAKGPAAALQGQVLPPGVEPSARAAVAAMPTSVLDGARALVRELGDANSPWMRVYKGLRLPEFRPGGHVHDGSRGAITAAIRSWNAQGVMQNLQVARIEPRLRRALQEAERQSPGSKKLVERFVRQHMSPEGIKDFIPVEALPEPVRALFAEGLAESRRFADDVALMLGDDPVGRAFAQKLRENDEIGRHWIHREYLQYLGGRQYAPDNIAFARALNWVVENRKGAVSVDEAVAAFYEMFAGDLGGDVSQRWSRSRLNGQILDKRSNVPPEIRRLMGELRDAPLAMAISTSEGERLWRALKVSQTFTEPKFRAQVWDDAYKVGGGMHPVPIPNNKLAYGFFAGKYVAPALFETIMQAPRSSMMNFVVRGAGQVLGLLGGGVWKTGATVLSHTTWITNFVSNFLYSAAAGLPPWAPRMVPRMVQAAKSMLAFSGRLTSERAARAPAGADHLWMQWALEDGAVRPGLGGEVGGSESKAIAQRILAAERKDAWGVVGSIMATGQGKLAALGAAYDQADSVFRLAAYIHQVERGLKRGLSVDQARGRASAIVNENFASAGTIGQTWKEAGRYAGALAPFMSWQVSNIAVHGRWLAGAVDPRNLGRTFNILAFYGSIAGMFELLRRRSGMTDGEVAAGEASLRTNYRRLHPWREWLPGVDARGRRQVLDLSNVLAGAMFLKGDPEQNILTRAAVNVLTGMTQGSGLEDPIRKSLMSLELTEEDFVPKNLPGTKGDALLERLWEYYRPGSVRVIGDALRRGQVGEYLQQQESQAAQLAGRAIGSLGRYEEPLTPTQTALRALLPTPVQPAGERSVVGERRAATAQLRDMDSAVRTARRTPMPPEKRDEIIRAAIEKKREIRKKQSQRAAVMGGEAK